MSKEKEIKGCELIKCKYWSGSICMDQNEYVNRYGESVCGLREDAIPYDVYLEEMQDNNPMMSFDRPSEY